MKFMMVILMATGWIASTTLASPVNATNTTIDSPANKVNATTISAVLKEVTSALAPLQKLHDDLVGKFDKIEKVIA
uniref:Putative secreted protein n=1 Tax=Panstrongylus lignarius TaxID=156445 RepID=A0A224Y3W4_9HEMI